MQHRSVIPFFFLLIVLSAVFFLAVPDAHAQIGRSAKTIMENILSWLRDLSIVAFTVCIIWAGYKMAFQGATWSDIAHIVIGGVLVGAAGTIASMLVGSGS